jgi:hypothetical protein
MFIVQGGLWYFFAPEERNVPSREPSISLRWSEDVLGTLIL